MTQARNAADLVNSAVLGGNLTIGNTTISATSVASDAFAPNATFGGFMRNRIINGAMNFWQRSTSATGTYSASYATVDRWALYSSSSMTTSQSTSVPTGFQYSLKVQRPAAATTTNQIFAFQVIENTNMFDLTGQSVTLSFWAKAGANYSSASSQLTAFVNTGTVSDQGSSSGLGGWTGAASPLSSAVTLTTTWTRYTITCTIGVGVLEMDVGFNFTPTGTAGADDAFYITGVQLELGSTATPFERRPYGLELALCQRYYEVIANDTSFGFLNPLGSTATIAATTFFKVTKRAVPTVSVGTGAVQAIGYNTATSYQSTAGGSWYFPSGVYISAEL
jgi:hypothetical protein